MRKLLIVLFVLASIYGRAQERFAITGTVTDEKGEELPGATVFLTNTQHNTATNSQGKFAINGLEAGNYEVVVKMLGYIPFVNKVSVSKDLDPLAIKLKENSVLLNTVTVKATDPNRDKYLKTFIKYFIGESTNANLCKLINPQVLNLHPDNSAGTLAVSADKFLTIENDGLGYRINYLLTSFKYDAKQSTFSYTGFPYFEELKGTPAQQKKWEKNRLAAYLGSISHFYRSVFNHTTMEDGFLIYPLSDKAVRTDLSPMPPTPAGEVFADAGKDTRLLKPDYNQHSEYDTTALYIFYKGAHSPYDFISSGLYIPPPFKMAATGQLSKLEPLANRITIDKKGVVTPQGGFLVSGYWAWEKMAEMLPMDYGQTTQPALAEQAGSPALAENGDGVLDDVITRFKQHAAYNAIEKIYLQLNKSWYNRADTIWFKVYTVMAGNQPTDISSVAYADLVNQKDSVIEHLKLQLSGGTAGGSFVLPIDITPGNYRLRAYTNWMRNQDEQSFYDQVINIGGVPDGIAVTTPVVPIKNTPVVAKVAALPPPATDLQFFPEGGTMVNGLQGKVAFKATNPDGSAAIINGDVIEADDKVVATLQTAHNGMGSFEFTPQDGKSYKARFKVSVGMLQTINLPAVEPSGFGLVINNSSSTDSLLVTVLASPALLAIHNGAAYALTGSMDGKIVFAITGSASAPYCNYYISKKLLPPGVVRFTLFNHDKEPVNERVVFVQPTNKLNLTVPNYKTTYAAGEKVNLVLNSATHEGKPVAGDFAISVINEALTPADENKEQTIFGQLLLSSELHGRVNDPGYYLANTDKKTVADLDLLMLTQGFRKFEWRQLLDTAKKPTFFAESTLSISGVVKTLDNKPAKKAKISLLMLKQHIAIDTVTDNDGRFIFSGLNIDNHTSIVLKALSVAGKNDVKIILDPNYAKVNLNADTATTFTSPIVVAAMKEIYRQQENYYPLTGKRAKSRDLKEVIIKAQQAAKPDLSTSANLHGGGQANKVIMGTELGACLNLSDCIGSLVPGLLALSDGRMFNLARGRTTMHYEKVWYDVQTDKTLPESRTQPIAVFLDGVLLSTSEVNLIDASSIYSIEVLTSVSYTSIYGQDGFGGVILITTKRGSYMDDPKNVKGAPNVLSYTLSGYYKDRTFYTPKYTLSNSNSSEQNRPAVYWSDNVITDKTGKTELQYTNAGKGNYRMVIEGIDDDGHIGRFVYRYKVL